MKFLTCFSSLILLLLSCQSQTTELREVGGRCEGCEGLYEYGDITLTSSTTIIGYDENEDKLHLKGTIYQPDGKTPASNVIMYFYQTNANGIYETNGDEIGWARQHGIYRGWIKTGNDGSYEIFTFRPASYPNTTVPQHIHVIVKEEDTIPYYIDSFFFEDDPNLPDRVRNGTGKRAGSGIVLPVKQNGIGEVRRDIILGLNIPDY